MRKSIACIGNGFVGGSLTTVFAERGIDVYVYDKNNNLAAGGIAVQDKSIKGLVEHCESQASFTDVYFVAVPTPMLPNGAADLRIVESVLTELAAIPRKQKHQRIAVVKSTCPPGSTAKWNLKFKNSGLCVIFNPEFLTEVNALNDFRNQDRIVLGGPRPYINTVKSVFEFAFPKVRIVKTSSTTAEMVKYTTNIALAVKVSLANELHQICQALDNQGLDIDYDKVIEYASIDTRLGTSHWKVPGPDGLGGFGGSCFPKDINALISVAQDLDIKPTMMLGAWYKNLEVRPERDWELLKGRAVS